MYDGAAWNAVRRSVRWPGCFPAYTVQETQGESAMTALQRAQCIVQNAQSDFFIYPADFFKIRELSVQAPLPEAWTAGFGASRASVTLSARNFYRWVKDEFPVLDPEVGGNVGFDTDVRSMLEHVPPPAFYTLSVQLVF